MIQPPAPLIFGLSGRTLTSEERHFFQQANPLGFILFRWNLENPLQIKALLQDLKETVGREDIPLLIDAEGGRVFRLPEAFYPAPPASRIFGDLYRTDPLRAVQACFENAVAIGAQLKELGFTVNCAPLLDLQVAGAHDVIGDRAFSDDPQAVGDLGAAVIKGLQQAGLISVIKHIPGHGAATVDSHDVLPVVSLSLEELAFHFLPFHRNAEAPWAMTAHIVYEAIDPTEPATFSPRVIQKIIREEISFKGFLISDDLFMSAVSGTPQEKVAKALAAGCDAVLYCKGGVAEFREAIKGVPKDFSR